MKLVLILFAFSWLQTCCCSEEEKRSQEIPEAKFVLPFPVGTAYLCTQGFNSSWSHFGSFAYSVDFAMPAGTVVTAARAGLVVYAVSEYSDSDHIPGHENVVILRHSDTTYSRYSHLSFQGVKVRVADEVNPGDTLGFSGNSGDSNRPHLHFDVTGTFTGRADRTIPFDFLNTSPQPVGLNPGNVYTAKSY
ncbi:MAG: M23 family metallopeptidase [Bacteroidetes bacterium]|nr:M23 family metallopeptidase [Bacteroidota bacterium]